MFFGSVSATANDGAYYMSGNQLVPMYTTQIDVKKEVLDIRREGDEIVVNVHYELYNKGKPVSLLVGFEAMPPSGDVNGLPKNGEHPYMTDFTASINGKPLQYEVALVPTADHWEKNAQGIYTLGLDQDKSPFYFNEGRINQESESTLLARMSNVPNEVDELYVYHFTADFESGKNTIDHSYRFYASGTVGEMFNFDYVLKAINRWGDSSIDDFQLSLDMGEMIEFNILNTFFDSGDEWRIVGVGKIYPTPSITPIYYTDDDIEESTTFALREGKAVFNKTNFTPKSDLFLSAPAYVNQPQNTFDASQHNLSFNYVWMDFTHQKLDDFSKKVLRNFPFARHGYVFTNKQLQTYYERQPWYIADPNYKAAFSALSAEEQQYVSSFK